ncbi:MAG: hypothetical protein EHM12_02410 [Dehalococcoidia bacterium]|nr:MAG: hypothetical protein EHM12_02410 [Dehalococcoidia bacterium]
MYHPLSSIPRKLPVFLALLAATIGISVVFKLVGPLSPTIVDYELAGSVAKVSGIINAWNTPDRIRAGFNLGIDYLYMPVYSTTIAMACVWGAMVLSAKGWRVIGVLLAWGLWVAAILDAIENYALVTMLFGTVADPYPQISQVCALCKFSLILLGLAYCALAAVIRIVKLVRNPRTA